MSLNKFPEQKELILALTEAAKEGIGIKKIQIAASLFTSFTDLCIFPPPYCIS
jgi:hypothetical protein